MQRKTVGHINCDAVSSERKSTQSRGSSLSYIVYQYRKIMVRRRQLLTGFMPFISIAATEGYNLPRPSLSQKRLEYVRTQIPASRVALRAANKKDENAEKKGSRAGDLLRSVGSLLPFSSGEVPQQQESGKETKEGGFLSIFQRMGNGDGRKNSEKQRSVKKSWSKSVIDVIMNEKDQMLEQHVNRDKKKSKPADKKADPKFRSFGEDDEFSSLSNLRRVQGFLKLNSTSNEKKTEAKTKKSDDNYNNPFSIMQKFAGSFRKNDPFSKTADKETWYPVFPKTRIMPGEMVPVTVGGLDLLVIASIDSRSLYCIANSCPHLGTPLETGKLTRLPTELKPLPETISTDIFGSQQNGAGFTLSETEISNILSQDGCEDCIVCPLHRTAFALKSGEVRGEWCPYPPIIGAVMGTVKRPASAAVFDVRTRGKNVEVRLNTILTDTSDSKSRNTTM